LVSPLSGFYSTYVTVLPPTDALGDLLAARHALLAADDPAERIGRLFESITPQSARRKPGRFHTRQRPPR